MKVCISEATMMPNSFADDVRACAEADCAALEVWLTKLETHLEQHSLDATKQLLDENKVTLCAASYQGGLLLSQGEQRKVHFDHYRRRLELCQALDIPTMLVVADFIDKIDQAGLERSVVSLKQAAQWAAGFNVSIALEFRGRSTFCASLDTAIALVMQCEETNVGVNLDFFHFYTGPSKFEDLAHLTKGNLGFVQVCDLAGVPRELASDSDRILPGDGDFRLEPIVDHLRRIGYEGYVSLELMNPTLWQINAAQVAGMGVQALKRMLNAE